MNNNNDNAIHFKCAPRAASLLWVNLTAEAHTALGASAAGNIDVHRVRESTQISAAIQVYAPLFLCFEFDQPDASGMAALAEIRCTHPSLPILMIIGGHSHAAALWALRIRVWDLLVKPVSHSELTQRIGSLIEVTRQRSLGLSRDIRFPSQVKEATPILNGPRTQGKTYPAIAHVTTHFESEITLAGVAALCCPVLPEPFPV